eukprot:gnl/MRDRNA2_/MRDRNA2_272894_c0_seq1.p1 gnl/MRDRNA2_/MRDRNA2_272894_c0~~gnl/MRDRNA2_/MRDRNA2_272894_c0_seq1.p1  ORF type:complete len:314 (+),score=63.07 gnl/MRDRNA2_/MRDRNA2_272894_c0_seq1:121-942(+)
MGAAAGGNAARQGSSMLGSIAGGLLGGLGAALLGGAQAGARAQQVFRFLDRVFLHSTVPEAWELAAQHLEIEGAQPLAAEIHSQWLLKARAIMDPTMQSNADGVCEVDTPQNIWLRLLQLCFSVEVLRHVPSPGVRISLPPEVNNGQPFRLDPEFLGRRVQSLLTTLAQHAMAGQGLTSEEIAQRCPSEALAQVVDDVCPVCLETYSQGAMVRRFPCNHIMHMECCDAWLATADTCAMCRHPVRQGQASGQNQPSPSSQPGPGYQANQSTPGS